MAHRVFISFMVVTGCCTGEIRLSSVPTMKAAQVTIATANQTAVVGEDITFTCTVSTSDPQPSLFRVWLRNLDYTEIQKQETIGNQSFTNTSVILHLKNVKQEDEGWYVCLVMNDWGHSNRSAWLTVLSDAEIPSPVNMTVLRTPLGILVRWEQPKLSIPIESYRVYYRKAGIENTDVWKTSDTNGLAIHILLSETLHNTIYDMKVQTKYSNGYFSRNLSDTVLIPDEDSQYKIYVNTGTFLILLLSIFILGILRIWRYHAQHSINSQPQSVESIGQGMDSDGNFEREGARNEETNHYESIASNDIDVHQPLTSAQPYAEIELDSLTAPKVEYNDNNYESANYIHPVAATIDSSELDSQYVHGRIPENFESMHNVYPVEATIGTSGWDPQNVHGRLPEDSESTNYIHPVSATIGTSGWEPQYVHGHLPEDSESTNYIHPVSAATGTSSSPDLRTDNLAQN